MRRFIAGALLGIGLLATPAPAQYAPAGGDAQQLVDSWYQRFLNRPRDSWGSVWIDSLQQGQPPESVLAKLLGSQEYYDKGGGTPEGFIQKLYFDLSGRQPAPQEVQYWVQRLYQTDRNDVAYQLLMRYPQSWQGGIQDSYNSAPPPSQPSFDLHYDYRRPSYQYRRERPWR